MIINHQNKWLYIGPPKTGSTSIAKILTDGDYFENISEKYRQFYIDKFIKQPPNFEGVSENGQHFPWPNEKLNEKYKDYFTFISVRNPYLRIVSLWNHWKYGSTSEKILIKNLNFERFVIRVFNQDKNISNSKFFLYTCFDWFKEYNAYVRLENLQEDLNKLNLHKMPFNVIKQNINPITDKWQEIHTNITKELTLKRAEHDFEVFGYSTKLPS